MPAWGFLRSASKNGLSGGVNELTIPAYYSPRRLFMDIRAIAEQLHSIRDLLRFASSRFSAAGLYYGHGTDNAWDEALMLILHQLHLPIIKDHPMSY